MPIRWEDLNPSMRAQLAAEMRDPARHGKEPTMTWQESAEQQAFFARIDGVIGRGLVTYAEQTGVPNLIPYMRGLYPALLKVFAVPNGGSRAHAYNKKGQRYSLEGIRQKLEGTRKGVLDILCPVRRVSSAAPQGVWSGCAIEMKRVDGGVLGDTPNPGEVWCQRWWIAALIEEGWQAHVSPGGEQAWRILCTYLGYTELLTAWHSLDDLSFYEKYRDKVA